MDVNSGPQNVVILEQKCMILSLACWLTKANDMFKEKDFYKNTTFISMFTIYFTLL